MNHPNNLIKKYLSVTIAIALFIVIVYFVFTQGPRIQTNLTKNSTATVETGNLPPWGNPSAPIKIIEFGDFLCPFCGQAVLNLYPQLESLINEGKVVVYFRDFVVHPEATLIHNAARCANEQGKYWEFNKEIFKKFMSGEETTKKEVWQSLAQSLGLDLESFNKCVDENRYLQDVQNDTQYGASVGVGGTPTFFINGQKVEGINIPKIQSILNNLLK
jgi:protein-disulfide isomerase